MGDEVVVVTTDSGDESEEVAEAIEDAIDESIEVEQSFEIGVLVGRLSALEEKVQFHDDLINLHSHEELADKAMVSDCEERMVGRIESMQPEEPIAVEEIPPAGSETSEDSSESEESNNDTPPKSRRKKGLFGGSIADKYYSSSRL